MQTTLIICDIQPEYEEYFDFNMNEFAKFLNRSVGQRKRANYNFGKHAIYFYNGRQTLDMCSEEELKFWLYEYGVSEETLDCILFFDKGYGFLREAIDTGIEENLIVEHIKLMDKNKLSDIDVEGMKISWNESFDYIKTQKNIVYLGGSVKACLLELTLGTIAFGVKFKLNQRFTY